jgi:exosortase
LLFLFWLVPIPSVILNDIVTQLQHGSAQLADYLFSAAGVPVIREGTFLSIPGLTIEVAKECSSIRSSLMLVLTSMVFGQLFLMSNWRKSLFVLAAIPLSIAKNSLRIFVLCMLAIRVNMEFLHGWLHQMGGIVFFLIALAAMLILLWILKRGERVPALLSNMSRGRSAAFDRN